MTARKTGGIDHPISRAEYRAVKPQRPSFAGRSRAQSRRKSRRQIDGSRAVDDSDAITHNAQNAIPIIPNVNTAASWPMRQSNLTARVQMIGKRFRKT